MKFLQHVFMIILLVISACKTNEYSFLKNYEYKDIPIIDSTSFANHVYDKLLTKQQQKLLSIDSIFGEKLDPKTTVGISYLPEISSNYKSIVYYFYIDHKELISMLVNYTEDYKIINSQMIAYDEIADGVLKTVGKIYSDKIVLQEFVTDNPTEIQFNILENGDITRK